MLSFLYFICYCYFMTIYKQWHKCIKYIYIYIMGLGMYYNILSVSLPVEWEGISILARVYNIAIHFVK